jgi:inner membrane protein
MSTFFQNQQTTLRFGLIGVIVLAMLIPLAMVEGVTDERQSFFDMTLVDISNAWGNAQNVSGPFLIVPEVHRYQVKNEDEVLEWRDYRVDRVILPTSLKLTVDIAHQFRKRAIYEVPVYSATINVQGAFAAFDAELFSRDNVQVLLGEAQVVVGISHTQAISSASPLVFGEDTATFRSGTGQDWIGSGVHAPLTVSTSDPTAFQFELQLKGTRQLGFTPVGGTTEVVMSSTWPHPSFDGTYLPERYDVTDNGFTAEWAVHELARDLPSSWRVDEQKIHLGNSFAFISLFQPVTDYTVIDRAIKYGLLFIALTFLAFVCFELTSGLRFHVVQYGVVGAGLVLFYLALLSLSEHIDFGLAYFIATAVLTTMIGWYVWAMTNLWRLCAWMAAIVAALYTTLYVLLQLEAFALLVGTGVLFVGLIALMATTRSLTTKAAQDEPVGDSPGARDTPD